MNLRGHSKEEPEVNLTSLIDVVLLLLIFFMITTSFVRETEIRLRLPEAETAPPASSDDALEITITTDGDYLVNGRQVINRRPVTLRRAMADVAGDRRDQTVVIRADARASHQSVVTAMDVAGRLGFMNINIATMEQGSGEER
ncbi:MAG: biopolymer transporter ExbD [Gammaproteobacteria bacterium]|nr:MAG: biopolymer transporter ExbD [Gammaproteobacteria bacterium]